MLDLRRLRRGAVVSVVASGIALMVAAAYHLAVYEPSGDAERGIAVLFTEGLLFSAIILIGLLAATFTAVRHAHASPAVQSLAAIYLNWAAAFLPAALIVPLLVGDFGGTFQVILIAAPVCFIAQAAAAVVAAVMNRWGPHHREGAAAHQGPPTR
ncbi:MAG: hypothetical protein ACRDOO_27085 [Actinomadura sp.]